MSERRSIEVAVLARVEGRGALHVTVEGDRVSDLRLEIFEPPRLFEAFLRGRGVAELPDLVARICGICPGAYQMAVVHALEQIFDVDVDPGIRALRRLYCAGEWIESHLLHMVLLAAPDYLGLDDVMQVVGRHRTEVERALRLRALGNRIVKLLAGRPVNPVGVCIGGFHRAPTRSEMSSLLEDLRHGRGDAEALLRWFASLDVPRRPQEIELVSLRHEGDYPMNEGRVVSSRGLDLAPSEFEGAFEEVQVEHSTALHSHIRGRADYLVGPLARLMLNRDRLSPSAAGALASLADRFREPDPAASVFARGVEVIQAIDDAIRVAEAYELPRVPAAPWTPRAGVGAVATEAPRGTLWMKVRSSAEGGVEEIRIVPPTAQNQARIEQDLRQLALAVLDGPDEQARRSFEAAIRDYDPCISCSTHFLDLEIERRPRP